MSGKRPLGFEGAFLRSLEGARKRHARYLGGEWDEGSDSDLSNPLNEIANFLNFQGMLIAHLAMDPQTSDELIAASPTAGERVPAWMEMRVFGLQPEPGRRFALGCAQLLGEQRRALERIIDEQIEDPKPIEEILEEHPIPTGDDEGASELMAGAAGAFHANFEASLAIARDYDEWIEEALREASEDEDY